QAASRPEADRPDVVAPAPVESGPEPLRSSNLPQSAPMPTDIAQPITVEQNTAATPKSAELSRPTAVAPVTGATRQPMPETPMAPEPRPLDAAERSPANLAPTKPAEPITSPAFPPAADDPFA